MIRVGSGSLVRTQDGGQAGQLGQDREAVGSRHAVVEQGHGRGCAAGLGQGLQAVGGLGHHADAGGCVQIRAQGGADDRVVVDHQDRDHAGTAASTEVPPPGRDETRSAPPERRARSDMPRMP
ncbi:hypothetical protein GCM10020218_052370 [Dactylosporangium vinaceum]